MLSLELWVEDLPGPCILAQQGPGGMAILETFGG